jgi:Zn-dependent protease
MQSLTLVQRIAIYALPLLLALTVREMMRGRAAYALGDDTGARLGRLSLNPLAHVDPVGTLILPVLLLAMSSNGLGGVLLGWPKLIPIDISRLHHPKRDIGLIAASGLLANVVMAFGWGVLLKIALGMHADHGVWLGISYMALAGLILNTGFFVLNLLPLPPSDGGRLLISLLPPRQAHAVARIEPYGPLIFLALVATPLLRIILLPPLFALLGTLFTVLSINPAELPQ